MKQKILFLLPICLFILSACAIDSLHEEQTAKRIASPAWMVKREIPAGPFTLIAFERIHDKHGAANIYIEGNGFGSQPPHLNTNPTPENPVALHLASKDKAENLIYLARPCQFTEYPQYTFLKKEDFDCDPKYWTNSRFSKTVINAYHSALNEIKARYDIKGFHLIGYDGGGGIATILAATRSDALSLRTVAGTLDTQTYTAYHKIPPLTDSLNPADFAEKLRNLPQRHYIGGQDTLAVPAILNSYLQRVQPSRCTSHLMVQEAEHEDGWVGKWPELLNEKPTCTGAPPPEYKTLPAFIPSQPRPIYRPREPNLEKGSSWTK